MGIIKVENVKPGMVLANKVLTSKNMMLLPEGTVLSDGHMLTFKTWGISEVNIKGAGEENCNSTLCPEEVENLKKEMSFLLKHNDITSGFAKELFEICCRTKRIQS